MMCSSCAKCYAPIDSDVCGDCRGQWDDCSGYVKIENEEEYQKIIMEVMDGSM